MARADLQGEAHEGLQPKMLPLSATSNRLTKLCQHMPISTGKLQMDLVGLSLWIPKAVTSLNGSRCHVSNWLGRVY